ncbi:MAG: CRISPR-associated primase-polymerase type B, partial [Bacteroidota bacterium]|nr:CRISPR-associated primase-polymerase type B [Bacteroidota bacterium]
MLSVGNNIKSYNDTLSKITINEFFYKIKNSNDKLISFLIQLKEIMHIDKKKYRELKTRLPYIVCGVFSPSYRKKENFAHTSFFILDIDHITEKEINLQTLKNKLKNDKRIVMMFISPSGDGIKLIFEFAEKCYDAGKYQLFYGLFAEEFSVQYNLQQVIDKKTSDVSRACFVSYDPDAYFNQQAEKININNYINFNNAFEVHKAEKIEKQNKQNKNVVGKQEHENNPQDLPSNILNEIRATLNPKLEKKQKEKQIYVPEELDNILNDIKNTMQNHKINTENIKNIHYGKQIKFSADKIWAEINLFYGKKGFTIVKTTKSGSNKEL